VLDDPAALLEDQDLIEILEAGQDERARQHRRLGGQRGQVLGALHMIAICAARQIRAWGERRL